jgi:hypothetical protein
MYKARQRELEMFVATQSNSAALNTLSLVEAMADRPLTVAVAIGMPMVIATVKLVADHKAPGAKSSGANQESEIKTYPKAKGLTTMKTLTSSRPIRKAVGGVGWFMVFPLGCIVWRDSRCDSADFATNRTAVGWFVGDGEKSLCFFAPQRMT